MASPLLPTAPPLRYIPVERQKIQQFDAFADPPWLPLNEKSTYCVDLKTLPVYFFALYTMVKLPTRFDGSVILMLLVAGTKFACGKARATSEWATFEMAGNRVGTNFVSVAGGDSKGS